MKLGELDLPATNAWTLFVFWIWSSFPLLWALKKGDVILLQELGQHVNFLLHTRALKMIALTTVCALAHLSFVVLLLGVLLGTLGILLRLVLISLFLGWIFRFFISFWIHPWISNNQSLVFGRFDGAHHHQLVLFLCEGFHELCRLRNLLGLSFQLGGMEGQNKHLIVRAKLRGYDKN